MEITLIVRDHFEAAHFIPKHKKCGKMHGHSYKVEVEFIGKIPYAKTMLTDFAYLKRILAKVLSRLDHKTLNDELAVPTTAEFIARWIYMQIREKFEREGTKKMQILSVTVWETDKYGARYEGEE